MLDALKPLLELHLDHSLRQLKLGGFSLEQSRQFLGRTEPVAVYKAGVLARW